MGATENWQLMTHTPHFTYQKLTLQLRNPFHLSYGVSDTREAYWIRLADDAGWGEGSIPPYYRVNQDEMIATWERLAKQDRPLPDDPEEVHGWIGAQGPAVARCAVELALLDRIGKMRGLPLYRLLGLPQPKPVLTSFTISIAEPEEMARQAREVAGFVIIKIKLGSEDDETRVAAVREARPDVRLFVDANAGWTVEDALRHVEALSRYNIELVEQPVAKDEIAGMGRVQSCTDLPVVADESAQSLENVEALAAAGVRGINLKLMKLGGLIPAAKIARRARELGLRLMLGSMIETSIGVTAMSHLLGMAEWLDLDAPLLISNDPFAGIAYDDQGHVLPPTGVGIGVTRRI